MRLAINQPYFLPYIGYFQLIAAADEFIVYDNIKYTKKGWINRNRFLRNDNAVTFTLPLKAGADRLDIGQRELAAEFSHKTLLNPIEGAYRNAPQFHSVMPLIAQILSYTDSNLFKFLLNSLHLVCDYLRIHTPLLVSSEVPIDHQLKAEDKVLALCKARGADSYINAIGGKNLYIRENFAEQGVELKFLQSLPMSYGQFGDGFVPWLSILDVMMFNSADEISNRMLPHYELQ